MRSATLLEHPDAQRATIAAAAYVLRESSSIIRSEETFTPTGTTDVG